MAGIESSQQTLRKIFVLLSACALAVFFMIQAWSAVESTGPAARVQELAGAIEAEIIERPLRQTQADHKIELLDNGAVVQAPLGSVIAQASKDGGIVFLNFWATWCKPCVRELPSMLELRRSMGEHKFTMLAVSYDENWNDVTGFFRNVFGGSPRELVVARDPQVGRSEEATLRFAFGTRKLPETYILKNGKVVARFVNERNWMDPAIVEYFKRLSELK